MNSMKSDWKPGLVSNKYQQNYDRIFRRKKMITDGTLLSGIIDFYYFDRMSNKEYEWKENKGEIDG